MNKLIKIELERAFKNKMLIISVVIGLVIVGFNIWNEIIPARKTLDKLLEMGKYSGIQLPGLYMKWMGVRPGSYVFLYYFINYAVVDSIAIFYKHIDGCEEALC